MRPSVQPAPRRPRTLAAVICLLPALTLVASCNHDQATAPGQTTTTPPSTGTPVARVDCVGNVQLRAVRCTTADSATLNFLKSKATSLDIEYGGQNLYVTLASGNVSYANSIFQFDVTVKNLIGQTIGTSNGSSVDAGGVKVFFAAGPTTTGGSGTIDFSDPNNGGASTVDGTGTFTASNQAYYQYNQMIDTGIVSAPKTWKLHVPTTVTAFTFSVFVNAPVQYPNGWVSITPGSLAMGTGKTASLTATVRDYLGRVVTGQTITWSSSSASVATIGATGNTVSLTTSASNAGASTITATAGALSGTTAVEVTNNTDIAVTVNGNSRFPISRFIYGMNFTTDDGGIYAGGNPWYGAHPPTEVTLNRMGGNRMSAFNWETGFSNNGSDVDFSNDNYLAAGDPATPGAGTKSRIDASFARGSAVMLTIPTTGWVAGDATGTAVSTAPIDDNTALIARLQTRFKQSAAVKPTAFSLNPPTTDGFVYQDEFVNFLKNTYPTAAFDQKKTLLFSLDNEPDDWPFTHKEIFPDSTNGRIRTWYWNMFTDTSAMYANAVKNVVPTAVIVGPAVAGLTGLFHLSRNFSENDPVYGNCCFYDAYLTRMKAAETTYGRRVLDVFDFHYYPDDKLSDGVDIEADTPPAADTAKLSTLRMNTPRTLWDTAYRATQVVAGAHGFWEDIYGAPARVIRRAKGWIATDYPGTKLSITEYWFGRGNELSGGIAEADALGVFGREGLYAATMWPQAQQIAAAYGGSGAVAYQYVFGAFRMYLNYDGAGGRFGDTGLATSTSDSVTTSAYGSLDANRNIVLMLINKDKVNPRRMVIKLNGVGATLSASAAGSTHILTTGNVNPVAGVTCSTVAGSVCEIQVANNTIVYTAPVVSVTVLVVRP